MPFKGAIGASSSWGRPSDWPVLPSLYASDQKFVGLYAVFNETSNFVALQAATSAGNVQYDWGDGTAPDVIASGVNAQHNYAYGASGLSPVTSEGFKVAIVTVTPVSGDLTGINLQQKHSQAGLSNYIPQWLDIAVNGPNLTTITLSGPTYPLRTVRSVYIGTIGAITSTFRMFRETSAIKNLNLFNTASVTDAREMFFTSGIKELPTFNFSACTTFANFAQESNIIIGPAFTTTSALLDIQSMYNQCRALQRVNSFITTNVTNINAFVSACNSLNEVGAFDFSAATTATATGTNPSLQSFLATGITRTISFAGCKMSTTALITALNNLGTAAGAQTVTITGNYGNDAGSAELTTAKNNAVVKGWTVVA